MTPVGRHKHPGETRYDERTTIRTVLVAHCHYGWGIGTGMSLRTAIHRDMPMLGNDEKCMEAVEQYIAPFLNGLSLDIDVQRGEDAQKAEKAFDAAYEAWMNGGELEFLTASVVEGAE